MKVAFYLIFILFGCTLHAQNEAFRDPTLTHKERAEDLLSRLSLEEKVSLMMNASEKVERLGIKPYDWWNEALHGVARAGTATVFPQAIGMAATFDTEAVETTFTMISDEARAKYHEAQRKHDYRRYRGLTFWTPNINIFRDPRWGRGQETYGEDPYLTSEMGMAVVRGLQGPSDARYSKTHACAKHYAVHSGPEWNRHSFNAQNIAPRDLWETYLPAFKDLVTRAGVREVMCAYNRFEGSPCCDNQLLLGKILREQWGYQHLVVSDCSAINDFFMENRHGTHSDSADASTSAVKNGTDLECGRIYGSLVQAVKQGSIAEEKINESLLRLLTARFELGIMDPDSLVSWSKIPYSIVSSEKHRKHALEMARKSMVLLKNNGILPLGRNHDGLVVMGPNAHDSVMQWGNYNGFPLSTVTILDGIRQKIGNVPYVKGCDVTENKVFDSFFSQMVHPEIGKGMKASYWNNSKQEGEVVAVQSFSFPILQDAGGATVFAPGVSLTGFSARYEGEFRPVESGETEFVIAGYNNRLVIDGKTVLDFWPEKTRFRDLARRSWKMKTEIGKSYQVVIDFYQMAGDAHMEFDLGRFRAIPAHQVVASVKDARVVIFAGGISPRYEGESMKVDYPGFRGGDRTDIELPAVQRDIIKELKAAGKKVIFISCSGSSMALVPEAEHCDAILQAWYPGEAGGMAVSDVLFGDFNPAGRLPVTFYKSVQQLPDFEDYSMQNRTYRFFTGQPLFPFGFGLSYTSFQYEGLSLSQNQVVAGENLKLKVMLGNTGKYDGDEVVQVYLKKKNDPNGPNKTLRAFRRVSVPAGKTIEVNFSLDENNLEWWDGASGTMKVHSGEYQLMVGGSSWDQDLKTIEFSIK